ncbi:MAG: heparan N-sulfatase, partial [Planctomycetaceae bacterium]|nr:heparan N-sulfatase [Planctomycetaceae bacterium]
MKRSLTVLLLNILLASMCCRVATVQAAPRPFNILMAISDDQSFRHTSAAGYKAIETP